MFLRSHTQVERLEQQLSKVMTDFAEVHREMSHMVPASMLKSTQDQLRKYMGELREKRCMILELPVASVLYRCSGGHA